MNILDTVTSARGGAAIEQLANQFGLKPQQASSAVEALMPALAQGLERNMSSPAGMSAPTSGAGNTSLHRRTQCP